MSNSYWLLFISSAEHFWLKILFLKLPLGRMKESIPVCKVLPGWKYVASVSWREATNTVLILAGNSQPTSSVLACCLITKVRDL